MATATAFIDLTVTTGAVAVRALEVADTSPNVSFTDGGNWGASNAPGIGIDIAGGALTEDDDQWTLLDQAGATRQPQDSSYLGNTGLGEGDTGLGTLPVLATTPKADDSGDGDQVDAGNASLVSLAAGWVAV